MPIRVLLADDSEVLRRTLSAFLHEHTGIELVGVAGSVPETLRTAREIHAEALVFDLHMAIRYEDLCHEFAVLAERLTLVAISTDEDENAKRLAARCGAAHLVDKMKLHELLVPTVVRAVNAKSKRES